MKVILGRKLKDSTKAKDEAIEMKNNLEDSNIKAKSNTKLKKQKDYNYGKMLQKEVARISKQVELMVILGNKTESSNILYNIAIKECSNAMLVETMEDLYLNYIERFKIVGVVADEFVENDKVETMVKILRNIKTNNYMFEKSRLKRSIYENSK